MALTFKQGKFYRDGIVEPLEFGNKDQLRIIENVKQLREEGAVPTMVMDDSQKFVCGISLQCVCGSPIKVSWEKQEYASDKIGDKVKCLGCDFTYVVCDDDYGFMFFKLVK
jgi:hypothetical protein